MVRVDLYKWYSLDLLHFWDGFAKPNLKSPQRGIWIDLLGPGCPPSALKGFSNRPKGVSDAHH